MNALILSYSLSGNNQALAKRMAKKLGFDHISITEKSKRGFFKIMLDNLLNRTPKVLPTSLPLKEYDFIVLVGPVWMGKTPSPLRACFKSLKRNPKPYAFVSISSGAGGEHPQLKNELFKRVGKEATTVIDLHIVDFLPPAPKPSYKAIQDYQLSPENFDNLSQRAVQKLSEVFKKI